MRSSEATTARRAGRSAPARHVASHGRGGRRSRLRVVRPPRPRRDRRAGRASGRRLGRIPFLIMSFVITGSLVFGVVTLQAILSQTSFRMGKLERQGADLRQSYGQLKLEVAMLSAPGRIAHEAKRLGLRLPDPSQVRTLSVQTPTPVATTPVSETAPSFALKGVLGEEP